MRTAGEPCEILVVSAPPTGSIRRRAQVVIDTIEEHCAKGEGPIHLIGHSTGGLDARLLTSPSVTLDVPSWIERVRNVVTLNTPHQGTPVAHFFSTLSGTRLLYALSLFTFATLRFSGPSMTAWSLRQAWSGEICFGPERRTISTSSFCSTVVVFDFSCSGSTRCRAGAAPSAKRSPLSRGRRPCRRASSCTPCRRTLRTPP